MSDARRCPTCGGSMEPTDFVICDTCFYSIAQERAGDVVPSNGIKCPECGTESEVQHHQTPGYGTAAYGPLYWICGSCKYKFTDGAIIANEIRAGTNALIQTLWNVQLEKVPMKSLNHFIAMLKKRGIVL